MSTRIPQRTEKCPHCGKDLGKYINAHLYGSPIQTCDHCKQQHLDPRYHEIAIDGIRPEDLSAKGNGKVFFIALALFVVSVAANVFYYINLSRIKPAALFAMLLFLAMLIFSVVDTIRIKTGAKQKAMEKERLASIERLQNPEYARLLAEIGYNIPEEYLK